MNHVEEFNISLKNKSNGLVLYNKDFVTTIEEFVVVRDHIFDTPLLFDMNTVKCDVVFKKNVCRYHFNDSVIFLYSGTCKVNENVRK